MQDVLSSVRSMMTDVGLRFETALSGEHAFEADFGPPGRKPFALRVTIGPSTLGSLLAPQPLQGVITVGGLCDEAPISGTLEPRWLDERRLRFEGRFEAAGYGYRFVGEMVNLWPWNLPTTLTTCVGRVTDDRGKLVSTSVARLGLGALVRLLTSLRLAHRS